MNRLSFEKTAGELAELILSDQAVEQRYNHAKMHWIGDPDPSYRHQGNRPWIERSRQGNRYVYSHNVFSGFSIARQSLLHVAKDPWHDDGNPAAYFVGEHDLVSGQVSEYAVLDSSVDRRRHLWLQTIDGPDLANWPAGKHPARHAEPRDQRRIEIDLTPDYRSDRAEFNFGTNKSFEFGDIVGLEAMVRKVQANRQPNYLPQYQVVAA